MTELLNRLILPFTPLQLYSWKKTAKAPLTVISLGTLGAYLIGIATFVTLLVTQSKSYTTETTIQVSDISNSEWTCSMASVVTQSVTLNATSNPKQYYEILNINELKSNCLADLHSVNPCGNESAMLWTSGGATTDYTFNYILSTTPVFGASSTFYILYQPIADSSRIATSLYDASTGSMTFGPIGTALLYHYPFNAMYQGCSAAMSKFGMGYFITGNSQEAYVVSFVGVDSLIFCKVDETCVGATLTNDNYNLYLTISSTVSGDVYANDIYLLSTEYLNASLLTTISTTNGTIVDFAVYCDDDETNPPLSSLYIYYLVAFQTDGYPTLYVYHDGVSTVLVNPLPNAIQYDIQLAASGNFVYYTDNAAIISVDPSGHTEYVAPMQANERFQMIANDTQYFYGYFGVLYLYDIAGNTMSTILSGFTDSIAGWYTCGSELMASGLPSNIDDSGSCVQNGITWQLQYTGTYYATEDGFSQMARSQAFANCNATLYDTICNKVGYLPPYICSRKQYLPFFTVFATAIANAHLLTVILFMAFGRFLSYTMSKTLKEQEDQEHMANPTKIEKEVDERKSVQLNPVRTSTVC